MLTKPTPPKIKELYARAMSVFDSELVHGVFSSEITVVVDRKPGTTQHDLWFYNFSKSHERFAMLTQGGEYLIMDSGLLENIVLNTMKGLPHAIQDVVDWVRTVRMHGK
jgi:hypothetical protein